MENENQRGFFGIIISKEILEDNELSIAEKFIYGYTASFTRCCFESNEKIAEKLNISESTVAHTIPKLVEKKYLFVEKVGNNSAARRIYSVFDNPKKLKYLVDKGMFQAPKPVEKGMQNMQTPMHELQTPMQNLHGGMQNMHSEITGVESAKFADIEKEENKNKAETEQKQNKTGSAGRWPAGLVQRSNYDNDKDFEDAFYKRNTVHIGAN